MMRTRVDTPLTAGGLLFALLCSLCVVGLLACGTCAHVPMLPPPGTKFESVWIHGGKAKFTWKDAAGIERECVLTTAQYDRWSSTEAEAEE